MKYEIQASIHPMNRDEVLAMVDPLRLQAIKAKDQDPEIRAYVIAHEGEAKGHLVGLGARVIQYFADAVRSIHDRVGLGTPLFHRHNDTNDQAGREAIGEVVGKALKEIGGKLHEVIAAWVDPAHRGKDLDIASIEADVEFQERRDGTLSPVSVENVSGVALSSSKVEAPGFPAARLLTAIQAFVEKDDAGKKPETGVTNLTKADILKAMKEAGLSIADLFSEDELREAAADIIKAEVSKETASLEKAKQAIQKRLGDKLDAKDAEIASLKQAAVAHQASGLLDALSAERKLTEAQKAFVAKRMNQFKTEAADETSLKGDLNRHLDAELNEFAEWQKLFGGGGDGKPNAGQGQGTGTPNGDGAADGAADRYQDPKQNEFIPA